MLNYSRIKNEYFLEHEKLCSNVFVVFMTQNLYIKIKSTHSECCAVCAVYKIYVCMRICI